MIDIGRKQNDGDRLTNGMAGKRDSEKPVLIVVDGGGRWGKLEGSQAPNNDLMVGTRVDALDTQAQRFRFLGGNGCRIESLPGKTTSSPAAKRPASVTEPTMDAVLASNRPQFARKLGLEKMAPAASEAYREQLVRALHGRTDIPEDTRATLVEALMESFYTVSGTSKVLVSKTVSVPSEGEHMHFRANFLLDTSVPAPEFASIASDWIDESGTRAEAYMVGDTSPTLTLMLAVNSDGGYRYAFFQFNAAKNAWMQMFEAFVPAC
jgi:hypothetical protein